VRHLVVGRGWLGLPAIESLGAIPFPHARISTDAPLTAAAERLRDAIRPDESTVVVNLCGLRHGAAEELSRSNAHIPRIMAAALVGSGAHLVQVGSAAEYGIPPHQAQLSEESVCSPASDYGVTKLQGTEAVLEVMPTATILRPFNVVDADLPESSPMRDIGNRISRAIASGAPVELLAASTIRDYVSRQFVIDSIVTAVRLRPAGVFNICSGVGVSTGEIARMALDDRQMANEISSSDDAQSSTVIGNPTRWLARTGLAQVLGCRGIVNTLGWSGSIVT